MSIKDRVQLKTFVKSNHVIFLKILCMPLTGGSPKQADRLAVPPLKKCTKFSFTQFFSNPFSTFPLSRDYWTILITTCFGPYRSRAQYSKSSVTQGLLKSILKTYFFLFSIFELYLLKPLEILCFHQ